MTLVDLYSCLKCGGKAVLSFEDESKKWRGACSRCDVLGPSCETVQDAAKQWNDMVTKQRNVPA